MSLNELSQKLFRFDRPFSIAMWDFSWRQLPAASVEAGACSCHVVDASYDNAYSGFQPPTFLRLYCRKRRCIMGWLTSPLIYRLYRYTTVEVLDSLPADIHCSDSVIVRGISAVFATEYMLSLVSVASLSMSAYGTSLGSVFWIHLDDFLTVFQSFVGKFLLEIIVCP